MSSAHVPPSPQPSPLTASLTAQLARSLAWLPAAHRRPLLQRLLIVWAVALPIAVATWLGHPAGDVPHRFEVSLVYAYAISTLVWLCTDVARYALKGPLRALAPHYWPPVRPAAVLLVLGVASGYVLGTLVGDAYAGWSTWDLWHTQPTRFMGMLALSTALSIAFVVFFYQRAKSQALASQATQSQLMLLQSQLEPHMLFNTLAHLRALIGQDSARALQMLDHLNGYLRTTLHASQQPLHPLADEFSRLHDYLSLMAIRMGPRMAFALDWPPDLEATPVPSFILQPLVENAIRHGLEPVVAGGRIDVQARVQGTQLQLTVQDSGQGMSDGALAEWAQWDARDPRQRPPQSPETTGQANASWGLRHVRQRLHALYGERAKMQLGAADRDSTRLGGTGSTCGTCVVLTLPLHTPIPLTALPTQVMARQ